MKAYYEQPRGQIWQGDCRDILPLFAPNSVDTVITDPPYELGFMGKHWDSSGVAFQPSTWAAVLRVAKPGAMLLAFGGTRTFHRLTCAIEDGGWEIRDCMMYLYGSGFPKSLDISKAIDKAAGAEREVVGSKVGLPGYRSGPTGRNNVYGEGLANGDAASAITAPATDAARDWHGWGTALKPAWEPIIVAMNPLDGTFAENAQRHGVAGLNIDGGRIGIESTIRNQNKGPTWSGEFKGGVRLNGSESGRWPANVVLDEVAAEMLDQQSGTLESGHPAGVKAGGKLNCYGTFAGGIPVTGFGDRGGASRFFYTAKASQSERGRYNNHSTVKPLNLMEYLCTLTATPTGGIVLDPFAGSFTTGVACQNTHREFIGIELMKEHCDIGIKRMQEPTLPLGGAA